MTSAIKFKQIGIVSIAAKIDSAVRILLQKHNEQVIKNRHVLSKIIYYLKYWVFHEIGLGGYSPMTYDSLNRGFF